MFLSNFLDTEGKGQGWMNAPVRTEMENFSLI